MHSDSNCSICLFYVCLGVDSMLLDIELLVLMFIYIVQAVVLFRLFKVIDAMHCQILKSELKFRYYLDEQRQLNNKIIEGYGE